MKRIFTSLILLTVLLGSAYGRAVFFENTVVEFPQGTNPQSENGHYVYQQDVLWTWWDGDNVINLHDDQDNDFAWSVETTGDMAIAEGYYDNKIGDNRYELKKGNGYGSKIHFTGTSGTLTVTALNPDFDGQPYQCTYTIIFHMNRKAKKWDFNTTSYHLNGSWDVNETHMSTDNPSVYHKFNSAINGDGSTAIQEAAGLKFVAPNGYFGGNNPVGNSPLENRFVFFRKNGNNETSITIPISTMGYTNPRVRIKMAKFGDHITLGITNAQDALGKDINSDYKIGGSEWWGTKGDNNYRGEYHFIVVNNNLDMKLELKEGTMLLLSIEVYDAKEISTENDVLANGYQLLNKEGDQTGKKGEYYLHFRGKGEGVYVDPNTVSTTGTVTCGSNDLTKNDPSYTTSYFYQSHVGEFGTLRFRIDCKDFNGTYCTDYGWRTHSVGYMQERTYPYTWDFTDIKPYAKDDDNRIPYEATYTASGSNVYSNSTTYNPISRNLWKANNGDYELQLAADAGHDVHYCGGSQLWYGKTIIPETQYLAFTPVNYDAAYDGAMTITSDGLKFDQDIRTWWLWRITVPSVPSNGVIYVHAKKIKEDDFYNVGYYNASDDAVTNKTEKSLFSTGGLTNVEAAREIADGDNGDVIYVIPASGVEGRDVTLFFTGVVVHKIAVSVDQKSVNKLGWATESRERVIDPELTAYMTGQPFEAYIVTGNNVKKKTVTLQTVYSVADGGSNVMNQATEGDMNAYIIHNTENKQVDMLKTNGGFHLFVPDMHDYGTENGVTYKKSIKDMSSSLLKSKLSQGTVKMYDGENTNYVLTYETAKAGWNENEENTEDYPEMTTVGFFRVQPKGVTSAGHQGYMQIATSEVKPASDSNSVGNLSLVFGDGETNSINNVEVEGKVINSGNIYYNLQGQQLNGIPTKSGIYIVNGKKIAVK